MTTAHTTQSTLDNRPKISVSKVFSEHPRGVFAGVIAEVCSFFASPRKHYFGSTTRSTSS